MRREHPMIINSDTAGYLVAVRQALTAGTVPVEELTTTCPDCGSFPHQNDHLVMLYDGQNPVRRETAMVVGCEGSWTINPATVGFDCPTWVDWRRNRLSWQNAGADDVGYQHAESRWEMTGVAAVTRAFFRTGCNSTDRAWSLELMVVIDGQAAAAMTWPPYLDEADAKAAAERFERKCQHPTDSDR
jgi:hypothetical protein